MDEIDVGIIGGGPAGLAAGLYTARARRRTVLWEGGVLGGQIALTDRVENYPGFPDGIDGPDLALAMHAQAGRFGMETRYEHVSELRREGDGFAIVTDAGETRARVVIVTVGGEYRKLGVPGEEELTGKGVSYCANCDAAFFKGQEVAVIGGGDAAVSEALFTTRFASKVWLVHRRDELRASEILQERMRAEPKIEVLWETVVERINATGAGDAGVVSSVSLRDLRTDERRELPVSGAFIFIGNEPCTAPLRGLVDLDEGGHALVNLWMETEVPGLFAAGDARTESSRQVVSAAGDGATAAIRAEQYLSERFGD